MSGLETDIRTYLQQFLEGHFSTAELKDLAADLGVDYESFPYESKSKFCRELIVYFERSNNLSYLLSGVLQRKTDPKLTQLLGLLPTAAPRKEVQLIVPDSLLAPRRKEDLLKALAQKLDIPEDEITLREVEYG